MDWYDWLIQGIGVLGIVASVIAFQCKRHYWILFYRSLSALIFALQYFLLGAYTGVAMDFLGVGRNFLFFETQKSIRLNPRHRLCRRHIESKEEYYEKNKNLDVICRNRIIGFFCHRLPPV